MIMNHHDPALVLMSQECVGASPMDANQEEKDSLDSGSANSTKVTPAQVQLGGNTKELPDKTNFTGESKECAVNSSRPKDDVDAYVVRPNRIQPWSQKKTHSLWF